MKPLEVIFVAAVLLLFAGASSAQLEGYWRFDDPQVSRGYSLQFDGSDDYVSSDFLSNSNYTEFTVTAWFKKPEGGSGWEVIASADHWDQNRGWAIYENENKIYFDGPNFGDAQTTGNYTDKKWHFLSARSNGSHVRLQIDDDPVITSSGSIQPSTKGIQIGSRNNNDGTGSHDFYEGSIDQITFYNRTLSENELTRARSGLLPSQGLIFLQNFNEGPECDLTTASSCLSDDSSFSNPGTPSNFNDNDLNTGSGWLKETPVNRPSVKSYSIEKGLKWFSGGLKGDLQNFDYNSSSGWTSGKIGGHALKFDGVDDRVRVNNEPSLKIRSELSLSAWIKTDNETDTRGIIDTQDGSKEGYRITVENGEPEFGVYAGDLNKGRTELRGNTMVADGSWHHVVGVWNGSKMQVYVDGNLESTATQKALAASNQDLFLGVRDKNKGWFDGNIDDARVYGDALSTKDVKSLYNGESVTQGLIGRWNFESGNRKKAYNSAGFSADGVLSSGSLGPGVSRNITTGKTLKENFSISVWSKPSENRWDDLLFEYRRSVKVKENSGQDLDSYQVNFTVDTTSLINDGKLSSDCSDLRFYSLEGDRLYHDVVSGCDTGSTEVVVEVDDLPANEKTRIWMYYGSNAEVSDNPEKAYYVYDLFGSGYDGTLTGDANYKKEDGFVELTENVNGQQGAINYTNGTPEPGWKASWEYYIGNGTDADALWLYSWASNIPGTEDLDGNGLAWILNDHDDCIGVGNNTQCGNFGSFNENPKTNQWETASAYGYRNGSNLHFKLQTLGNQTSGVQAYSNFSVGDYFGFGARTGGANNYHWVKNIKVSKYVEPSPSVSMGEEQKRPEIVHSENITLSLSSKEAVFEVNSEVLHFERRFDRWHKITAVYNGSYLELYEGVEKVGEKSFSGTVVDQKITVARNYGGSIDELRLYQGDLSQSKIQELGFQ